MTIQQIKALGALSESQSHSGILKRIEGKCDTIISNQSGSSGGNDSGGGNTPDE